MIERNSKALLDLATHVVYLQEKAGAETALRFLDSVEDALQRLEANPYIGRVRHFRQTGLRSWMVPELRRWLIFYLPIKNGIRVYRVIHSSMNLDIQLGKED